MGGRGGESRLGTLTRPHAAGLEDGARLASTIAGVLLIGAGVLHVSAAGDHTNLPVMLVGFLVVATAQFGLGGLLLMRRPGRLLVFGGAALTLGAISTWLVSRTAGLPFLPGGHMEPVGFKDGVTVLFEIATVPALVALASAELDHLRMPSPRLGSQAMALLGAGMFALSVPALVLSGGGHHSADEMAAHDHGAGDDHGHDGEQLAQASGGHAHGDGEHAAHDGGGKHAEKGAHDDGHAHGQPATEKAFADAHSSHADHDDGDGAAPRHDHAGTREGQGEGGHRHGGGEERSSERPDDHGHGHGRGDQGGDPGHGDDHGAGMDHGDGHGDHGGGGGGSDENERSLALESGHSEGEGRPARGPALVFYDQPDQKMNGTGHDHAAPCEPTAAQRAAADRLVEEVRAELRPYENNPAAAIADGFNYVFGPTDRMLHVVSTSRLEDPDVLKAPEIESFIYYMTDTGFVPIGGMFVMPRGATGGPEPGGCLTQWHEHGGVVGRWATAGTSDKTPLMMHVFTYPGLDPWGHYNGRDLAPLWAPGQWIPSVCRSSGDANDGCLP